MHILLASGGVSQYFINEFVRHLVNNTACKLTDLDEFYTQLKPRGTQTRLSKVFWKDRTHRPTKLQTSVHMKAFASEMLSAIEVLMYFSALVLKPAGVMEKHIEALVNFNVVCEIVFGSGDMAKDLLPQLNEALHRFAALFIELYGKMNAKPKFHYMFHIPRCILHRQKSYSCFVGERSLRIAKGCSNSYNKYWETALRHCASTFIGTSKETTTYERMYLNNERKKNYEIVQCMEPMLQMYTDVISLKVGPIL